MGRSWDSFKEWNRRFVVNFDYGCSQIRSRYALMQKSFVTIDKFHICLHGSPFVIAEAGVNHNGDLSQALRMIEVAKESGADAVKFQTFVAEEFCGDKNQTYAYNSQGKLVTELMLDMFKRFEFSYDEWRQIKEHCDKQQILFLSTAQNRSDLNLLLELGISAIKVGSDDLTHTAQLADYATTNLPIIISCGMATLAEVDQALEAIGTLDGHPTILLLCTSEYPTPAENVNLLKIKTLATAYPGLPIGLSDHTIGPLASSIAIGLGACCFEKHFTLDNDLPGPDHWFSENPIGLAHWIQSIRTAYTIMGSGVVRPTEAEYEMRSVMRRSILALRDIKEGEQFTEENIGLRRPGAGLSPLMYREALKYRSDGNLKQGSILKLSDFR